MMKKQYVAGLLMALYLFSTGCAALIIGAGAGTAGMIWYKGKLEETVSAPVAHVHTAILAGLKDMNIAVTEDRSDKLTSEVRAVLADGKKVWIDAEAVTSSITKMTIRVGLLGDKEFSLRIRDAIRRNL